MSDSRKLTYNNLSQYDSMTAEELAAVLRADLEAEGASGLDSETLLHVMKLYAQRQPDKPPKTAEEAFAAFRRNYFPRVNEPSV